MQLIKMLIQILLKKKKNIFLQKQICQVNLFLQKIIIFLNI